MNKIKPAYQRIAVPLALAAAIIACSVFVYYQAVGMMPLPPVNTENADFSARAISGVWVLDRGRPLHGRRPVPDSRADDLRINIHDDRIEVRLSGRLSSSEFAVEAALASGMTLRAKEETVCGNPIMFIYDIDDKRMWFRLPIGMVGIKREGE